MKKQVLFIGFFILSLKLVSQHSTGIEELGLDFSWDSKWTHRYDYQIVSPHDSSLLGKLTQVSENFWQKEIYDLQGNWLDTYRFVKDENGQIHISMGESIIEDRYYENTNLQKRLIAVNGKPIETWDFTYNANSQIQRFSIEDSLSLTESVFLYDSLHRVERIKRFSNGDLVEQEHYQYRKQGTLQAQYTLASNLDSLRKVDYVFKDQHIVKRQDYKYQGQKWVLIASQSYEYSPSRRLESINYLSYSSQGNCIFSTTETFNKMGLIVSREQIDLISGDWHLIKSFYQSSEQGIIVLGADR